MRPLVLAACGAAALIITGCATPMSETTTSATLDQSVNGGYLTTVVDGGAIYEVTVPESDAAAMQ